MDCAVSQGLVLCPLNIGARRKNGSVEWQVSIGLMFCPTPCHANSRTSMIRLIPSFFYGVVAYAVLFSTVSLLYPICLLTHLVLDVRVSVRVPEPVLLYFPYCIPRTYFRGISLRTRSCACIPLSSPTFPPPLPPPLFTCLSSRLLPSVASRSGRQHATKGFHSRSHGSRRGAAVGGGACYGFGLRPPWLRLAGWRLAGLVGVAVLGGVWSMS